MPRPQVCLCSNIKFKPNVVYFKPQGIPFVKLKIIELSREEVEAYRLRYIEKMQQKEAALKMKTSFGTYQRILNKAYFKIADALINGKAIKFINH